MAPEEFEVRIMRNGRVVFNLEGLDQERIRHVRQVVEEVLGPILAEGPPPSEPAPPRRVKIPTRESPKQRQKTD